MYKRNLSFADTKAPSTNTVIEKEKEHQSVKGVSNLHDMTIHAIHCIGITFMYLCQGLVQGTIGIIPLTIVNINKDFPAEAIAALGLPIYAFSLKFLWAPIVDLFYVKRWYTEVSLESNKCDAARSSSPNSKRGFAHRRLQWVTVAQLAMALGYFYLFILTSDSDEYPYTLWNDIAMGERTYIKVLLVLLILAFSSSTQDVAVDAWAVEGLPSSLSNLAGTMQMIGLTVGISLSSLFLYLHTANTINYPLSNYFMSCAVACCFGVLSGIIVSIKSPLYTLHSACEGSVCEIAKFITTPSVVDIIIFLLTRGVAIGGNSLASLELIRLNWMTTNEVSTVSLMTTGVSLFGATFVAPMVLKHYGGTMIVLQHTTKLSLALQGIFMIVYMYVTTYQTTPTPEMQWWYFYAVMIPHGVFSSLFGSVSFVTVTTQFAKEAMPFPNLTGTAVTILNSFSNMGFSIPSSVVMFSVSYFIDLLGVNRVRFSLWIVITLFLSGAALQYLILLPAVRRLQLKS
eukprot:Tbor_TRINITY_DN2858_c0_g1::TRINITY_DN2858_c0_g1_i1::g.23281::m.23281/K03372/ACATN, SLC33A1; MFS transporter, PAT family, solute carrier family 33 (acetyl-CoA transportor), member 1